MKHLFGASLFVGTLALGWTLAGCGNNQEQTATPIGNTPTNSTATNAADAPTSTPETGAALGTPQEAGPFQVTLSLKPAQPKVGDARFTAKVTRDGQPVTNGTVKLDTSMPTMNMGDPDTALKHTRGGVYEGTLNLSMGGYWEAKVIISAGGATGTATYGFTAMQ